MSIDINHPLFGANIFEPDQEGEGHAEPGNESMKSNVVDYQHPMFTSEGAMGLINSLRNMANTEEKELTGQVPEKVFQDMCDVVMKTKVPYDLLLMFADWDQDLTQRSSASDTQSIAQKMTSNVSSLRQTLGRDPLNAEMFMAHALGDAGRVKQLLDMAEKKPDEIATPAGSKKDNIIYYKMRNGKKVQRTNREVVDFFARRLVNGKVAFKQLLGKDKYL